MNTSTDKKVITYNTLDLDLLLTTLTQRVRFVLANGVVVSAKQIKLFLIVGKVFIIL